MRWVIIAAAAVCYGAALAIAGAGLRLSVPQSLEAAAPAETPVAPPPIPGQEPQPSTAHLETAVVDLAREQAANRELVSELRTTVARLQDELIRQKAALPLVVQERSLVVLGGDLFPPGEKTLKPEAQATVSSLLAEILRNPRETVSVEGHTDSRPIRAPIGKPFRDNADLSLQRARAVAAFLASQGVPDARLRIKGWGDTRPLATNDTAEGRDRNRRVEIRLLATPAEP